MDDVDAISEYRQAAIQSIKAHYSSGSPFEMSGRVRPGITTVLAEIAKGPGIEIDSYCEYAKELAYMLHNGEVPISDGYVSAAVKKIINELDTTQSSRVCEAITRAFVIIPEAPEGEGNKATVVLKKYLKYVPSIGVFSFDLTYVEPSAVALALRGDEEALPALQRIRKQLEVLDASRKQGGLSAAKRKEILVAPFKEDYFGTCELASVLLGENLAGMAANVLNKADSKGLSNQYAVFALLILGEGDSKPITREGSRFNGKTVKEMVEPYMKKAGKSVLPALRGQSNGLSQNQPCWQGCRSQLAAVAK